MKTQKILAPFISIASLPGLMHSWPPVRGQEQVKRQSIIKTTGWISTAIIAFLLLLFGGQSIYAQSETPKWELGAQFSILRHNGSGYSYTFFPVGPDQADVGIGGRITYNATKYLSLEGEVSFFPRALPTAQNRRQGVFGVKAGKTLRESRILRQDQARLYAL